MAKKMNNVVFRPTLIIGLGGFGNQVVLGIKKSIFESYGDVPIVKYLGFDTTEESKYQTTDRFGRSIRLIPGTEFFYLPVRNPQEYVKKQEHIKK